MLTKSLEYKHEVIIVFLLYREAEHSEGSRKGHEGRVAGENTTKTGQKKIFFRCLLNSFQIRKICMMIFNGNYSILLNLKTKDDDN